MERVKIRRVGKTCSPLCHGGRVLINRTHINKTQAQVTFFVPDDRKTGWEYVTITGNVRRIDDHNREIVFDDGIIVANNDVKRNTQI